MLLASSQKNGFTLVELAIVILIAGLLMGIGIFSWQSMMKARRIAATRSALYQAKDCLLTRIASTNKFPDYSSPVDCDNPDSTRDVDFCLCQIKDAWGKRIVLLEGRDGTGCLSSSSRYVTRNKAASQMRATLTSQIRDTHGKTIKRVAFVLISKGEDGKFDSKTYGDYFPNNDDLANCIDPANPIPDFSNNTDDIMIVITGNELQTILDY